MSPNARLGRRLRCLGHVINLSAKAFFYGKEFDALEKDAEHMKEHSELLQELNIWRKRGLVGRLYNVVIFICRSPQRRQKFADIKAQAGEPGDYDKLSLLIDNATRWKSLYSMIERAIKLRDRIDRFCIDHADSMHGSSTKKAQTDEEKEHLLKNDTLDWIALAKVMNIFKKFYDFTKRAEGTELSSDRGILSDYMTTLNTLLNYPLQLSWGTQGG